MRAVCREDKENIQVETVPDPACVQTPAVRVPDLPNGQADPGVLGSSNIRAVTAAFVDALAKHRHFARAAAAILALDVPLTDLLGPDGALPKIEGIGPGSTRIIREVLATGESPAVERTIDQSGNRADIERRRRLRGHFLSRAEVRRVLSDSAFNAATSKCTPNGATAIQR